MWHSVPYTLSRVCVCVCVCLFREVALVQLIEMTWGGQALLCQDGQALPASVQSFDIQDGYPDQNEFRMKFGAPSPASINKK